MGEERGIPEVGTDVARSGGVKPCTALGKIGMAGTGGKSNRHQDVSMDAGTGPSHRRFWKGSAFVRWTMGNSWDTLNRRKHGRISTFQGITLASGCQRAHWEQMGKELGAYSTVQDSGPSAKTKERGSREGGEGQIQETNVCTESAGEEQEGLTSGAKDKVCHAEIREKGTC